MFFVAFGSLAAQTTVGSASTEQLLSAMKLAADGSSTMVSWAISIIGGSIAAIVSTSYLRPENPRIRLIYLLYLPAWALLGASIYEGHRLSDHLLAANFGPVSRVPSIASLMNDDFSRQQSYLATGIDVFGLWLGCFVLWWVFGKWHTDKAS